MKAIFTGGGTAGHVTPNIALIEEVSKTADCFYIGTNGMEKTLIEPLCKNGKVKSYHTISASKLRRKFSFSALLLPFKLLKSIFEAKKILKQLQPDVIFSKGGFVGLPVVIAGRMLKIKTIGHESDISMGLANKISERFTTVMLSAFPCSKKAMPVGAIVRKEIYHGDKKKGLQTMGFDGKKPILLVTGGSLGAQQLNDLICNSKELSTRFDIFVICGKGKKLNCDFVSQAEFVSNMADVLAASTLAVTRGGSNSLVEMTISQVPFVTIPLLKSSRGEQLLNAEYFCKKNCGVLLKENITPKSLQNAVNAVFNNISFFRSQQAKVQIDGTQNVLNAITAN